MWTMSPRVKRLRVGTTLAVLAWIYHGVSADGCPSDSSLPGFATIKELNAAMLNDFDLLQQGIASPPFLYYLCPDSVYQPGVEELWIEPLSDDTTVQCGIDGKSENNCIIDGGEVHVALLESREPGYVRKKTTFRGIHFNGSNGWSVAAYDSSKSYAEFIDCHWRVSLC